MGMKENVLLQHKRKPRKHLHNKPLCNLLSARASQPPPIISSTHTTPLAFATVSSSSVLLKGDEQSAIKKEE
jgi:hypothetical protein